jgi:SAM-dependent methyltransferase
MAIEKRRKYENYEQYVEHQLAKTSSPRLKKRWLKKFDGKVKKFKVRFSHLEKYGVFNSGKSALCMGARMGEEVVALKEMGIDALGIDLEPNPPNVIKADFNNLPFDPETYDIVYTNSFDHAFDADVFFDNVYKVLKKDGYFIIDVFPGEANYARCEVLMIGAVEDVIEKATANGRFEFLEQTKDLPKLQRRHEEVQVVFRRK